MLEIINFNTGSWILAYMIAVLLILGLLANLCMFISRFSSELKYLNEEVKRTEGAERKRWIRRRRRHWLSLIPFVKH